MMKCNGCGSLMTLDRSESGQSSSSEWYQCSLCGKVRLMCSKVNLSAITEHGYSSAEAASATYPQTSAIVNVN